MYSEAYWMRGDNGHPGNPDSAYKYPTYWHVLASTLAQEAGSSKEVMMRFLDGVAFPDADRAFLDSQPPPWYDFTEPLRELRSHRFPGPPRATGPDEWRQTTGRKQPYFVGLCSQRSDPSSPSSTQTVMFLPAAR
jgi:hypothetical protein